MIVRSPSDDEIVAILNASDRAVTRLMLILGGAVLLLVALYAAAFFAGEVALLQSEGVQIAIGVLFVAAVAFVVVRSNRHFRSGAFSVATDPRIIRRRIDTHHRYWRWTLLSALVATSASMLSFSYALGRLSHANHFLALIAGAIMIVVMGLFAAHTLAGPGWFNGKLHAILNDDFVRQLRARTARLGYLAMMVSVSAGILAALWRPNLALQALAWSLYAGFAIPTLYYVIADWRAGREK